MFMLRGVQNIKIAKSCMKKVSTATVIVCIVMKMHVYEEKNYFNSSHFNSSHWLVDW